MKILGIETSCDETAVSIVKCEGDLLAPQSESGVGKNLCFNVLGSAVNSQIDIHKQYGGVFPTLAKREHIKNLPIVYREALEKSGVKEFKIEAIAVTVGPGLEPALWTGIKFAEDLSNRLNIPVIPTNHMNGHLASVLLQNQKVIFPAVGLLISGGHTELVLLKNWLQKEKLGATKDDAVGEAFDKVARMMGLPYPGGPEISRLASRARESGIKNQELRLPRPMIRSGDYNFSFSGLKTAVLYLIRGLTLPNPSLALSELSQQQKMEIAREFEDAVIETLVSKTKKAINEYNPKTLIIGGGVIANKALRENFLKLEETYPELKILIPEKELATDNATMIAAAGYLEFLKNRGKNGIELQAKGNLEI